MDTKDLLNLIPMVENEVIFTPQKVRDLLNQTESKDYDLEEDEKIVEKYTVPGDYKLIGLEYDLKYLITEGDWKNLQEDLAFDFVGCLPDGFEPMFNTKALLQAMEDDYTYMHQVVDFINKMTDDDYQNYSVEGHVESDGVNYVVIKEL